MLKIRVSSLNGRLVRAVSRGQVRYCSVTPKSPESEAASSKRKEFRKIELDMNIMRKLDHMNVGFIPKRKMRVAVAQRLNPHSYRVTDEKKRYGDDDEFQKAVPFPFRGTGKVLHTAANVLDIPTAFPGVPPEIALIGRSNVGKSTLLNALLGFDNSYVQKAIVSDKPGETKYLTFFQLGMSYKPPQKADKKADIASIEEEPEKLVKTPALMFVDMPGYGFAFMSEEEKLRCHMLCLDYLISNPSRNKVLKRVVLLLDGRHGLKASDIMFLQDLQQHLISSVIANSPAQTAADLKRVFPDASAVKSLSTSSTKEGVEADSTAPITISMAAKTTKLLSQHLGWKLQIVLTKCDLVDRPELCRRIIDVSRTVSEKLPALYHSMLPTLALSAMQLRGVQEMQRDLAALVPPKWEGAPNNRKPEPESVESEKAFFKDTKSDLPHNRGKYASADRKADPVAGASKPNKWTKQTAEQNERLSFSERRKQREQELTGKVSEDCAPSRRATSNKSENTKETVKPDINTASSYSIKERIVPAKVFNAKVFNEATVAAPSPAAPPQAKASHQTSQQAAPVAAAAATKFTGKNPTPSTLTPPTPTATTSSNSSSQGQGKGKGKPVKAPRVAKKKHKLLEDYRDELDEYFGDDNLDMDELMDSDGFDSDLELDDGTDDYFGSKRRAYERPDSDDDDDDEGVNWEAAGEYGDDFSDDDDELIEEELRVGNVTGYRRQLNTSKHSKPKKGKAAAKSAATGSGSGSGSGSSAAGGAHNSSKAPAQAPAESAAPRHSKGKGGAAGAGKADKGGLPRRVPKTPDNPKGRHRLAKPEDFAAATGKGAKGPKGAKYTKGAAAAGKAGNKFNKAGVKPKSEKAPRRRYY